MEGGKAKQAGGAGQDGAAGGGAAGEPPSVDNGPAIAIGQSPWTPFDSRLAGAILCGIAAFLVLGVLFVLPFWFFTAQRA